MKQSYGQGSKSEREAEQNNDPVPGPVIVPASARGWGGQVILDVCTALSTARAWSPELWAR